jgi:hypothetical protein
MKQRPKPTSRASKKITSPVSNISDMLTVPFWHNERSQSVHDCVNL